jgi:hypothetical protein
MQPPELASCRPLVRLLKPPLQFYQDMLPYQDFSVRLGMEDIPRLGPLLRAIDDREYQRLQDGMRRWGGSTRC